MRNAMTGGARKDANVRTPSRVPRPLPADFPPPACQGITSLLLAHASLAGLGKQRIHAAGNRKCLPVDQHHFTVIPISHSSTFHNVAVKFG
eukprot:750130-Hanusia_phi.AAC.10